MAFWYLVFAVFLAVTLNQRSRFIRGLGTAVAALGLLMMVSSIVLAAFNGTVAHKAARWDAIGDLMPLILNLQTMADTGGILFLLWASWRPFGGRQVARLAHHFVDRCTDDVRRMLR
jgi:hypothetical protein